MTRASDCRVASLLSMTAKEKYSSAMYGRDIGMTDKKALLTVLKVLVEGDGDE
jgi:hypothetical protein